MTEKQRQGMVRFHLKAAKAYRSLGQNDKAERAEAYAKQLQGFRIHKNLLNVRIPA